MLPKGFPAAGLSGLLLPGQFSQIIMSRDIEIQLNLPQAHRYTEAVKIVQYYVMNTYSVMLVPMSVIIIRKANLMHNASIAIAPHPFSQTCSMEVNCESIAVMGATLASGGECPTTGEEVLKPEAVRDVLSLMHRSVCSRVFCFKLFYFNLTDGISRVSPNPQPREFKYQILY